MGRAKKVKYSYYGYEYVAPALLSEWQAVFSDGNQLLETNPIIIGTYSPGDLVCLDDESFLNIPINNTEIGYPGIGDIGSSGDIIFTTEVAGAGGGIWVYYFVRGINYADWEFKVDTPDFSTLYGYGEFCSGPPPGPLDLTWIGGPGGSGSKSVVGNTTYTLATGNGSFGALPDTVNIAVTDSTWACFTNDFFILDISNNYPAFRFTQRIGDCYIGNTLPGSGFVGFATNNPWTNNGGSITSPQYYTYEGKLYYTLLFYVNDEGDYYTNLNMIYYTLGSVNTKRFSFDFPAP